MTLYNSLYTFGEDSPIPLDTFLYNYLTPSGIYYDSAANFINTPPGSVHDYSNVGAALIGYLVEVIEDSFPVHCQDSIFHPIEMNETGWFLANLDTSNIAMPYHWNGTYYSPIGHYGFPTYPDGQLRTSLAQLVRYLTAFRQYGHLEGDTILDSTTVELMTTVQYEISTSLGIGLIWFYEHLLGMRWIWRHYGNDYGVATTIAFCPAENSAVIVLTNGESLYGAGAIMYYLFEYALEYGIVENQITPVTTIYLQVNPNPFTRQIDIRYQIIDDRMTNSEVDMTLRIYDASGRLVRDFGRLSVIGYQSSVKWDGTDQADRQLGSGVYFVSLSAGSHTESQKLLLVR
ncbi:MAG: serine hydrolase [candidate division WOR-3 bacterium]|nr:serine hydrolase [candidate division WOR-3 bacterium]